MKKNAAFFGMLIWVCCFSCVDRNQPIPTPNPTPAPDTTFIRAADLSFIPEAEASGCIYKKDSLPEDPLVTLKNAGCNVVRLRLWHNPSSGHSGLSEVTAMASRIHQQGMKVWLSVHFSDTWADPGAQTKPLAWQNLSFTVLNDSLNSYMTRVMNTMHPEIVQIGNETNDGLLWPEGKLSTNESQCLQLMQTAINAVRAIQPTTKIILHYGGLNGASWFLGKVQQLNYDYIGLSYYPVWHGTSLNNLQSTITTLAGTFNKKVIIAETAYPFTLSWNDWTNNIVGLQNQLIPGYDASPSGQLQYLTDIKNWSKQSSVCAGFCYWGGEWVSFRGPQATNGSSWENQALWDFNNNALPAINAFNSN